MRIEFWVLYLLLSLYVPNLICNFKFRFIYNNIIFSLEILIIAFLILSLFTISKGSKLGSYKYVYIAQKFLNIFTTTNYSVIDEMCIFLKKASPEEILIKMEKERLNEYYFRQFSRDANDNRRVISYLFYCILEDIAYIMLYGVDSLEKFQTNREELDFKNVKRCKNIKKSVLRMNSICNSKIRMKFYNVENYYYSKKALDAYIQKDFDKAYKNLYNYSTVYSGDNKQILLVLMYVCGKKSGHNIEEDISEVGKVMLEEALQKEDFKNFVNRELVS